MDQNGNGGNAGGGGSRGSGSSVSGISSGSGYSVLPTSPKRQTPPLLWPGYQVKQYKFSSRSSDGAKEILIARRN